MLTRRQKLKRFYRRTNRVKYRGKLHIWFEEECAAIREFYLNCPDDKSVDHIIPLNGKNVTGLHTLTNLQYLTPEENRTKRNYFEDFQGWTKEFEAEYMKQYAKDNAKELSEYRKQYREIPENKAKAKEYMKVWYAKKKELIYED